MRIARGCIYTTSRDTRRAFVITASNGQVWYKLIGRMSDYAVPLTEERFRKVFTQRVRKDGTLVPMRTAEPERDGSIVAPRMITL